MSFLNPVNKPVLRFSSTDAGAPQINYSARVAGDVKAVLKACLVTGYGAKASAGWSAVNETATVIEFVSPSADMSNYRIGITDASVSSIAWYYRYKNTKVVPVKSTPSKNFSYIDNLSTENGWELIVTNIGMYFVEILFHTELQKKVARLTWIGQLKSGLLNDLGVNISFFCVGIGSQIATPSSLMSLFDTTDPDKTYNIGPYKALTFNTSNSIVFSMDSGKYSGLGVDVVSDVFLSNGPSVVAQQSGLLMKSITNQADAFGVAVDTVDGRPVLGVSVVYNNIGDVGANLDHVKKMLIRLDYWEH